MDSHFQIFSYTISKQTKTLGNSKFWIQLDEEPFDIAVIGSLDIAVLLFDHIKWISVGECSGIKREIPLRILGCKQHALAFSRYAFYVAQQNNNTLVITVLNSDGHSTNTINVCRLRSHNIDVQLTIRGNTYCSVFDPTKDGSERNTVYCYDKRNMNLLWHFSDTCLAQLYGCTTDVYRNVYATNGNHLTVISANGINYKILLKDVLPFSDVFFDDSDNCLVVCSSRGTIQLLMLNILNYQN